MNRRVKMGLGVIILVIALLIIGIVISVYPLYQAAEDIEVVDQNVDVVEERDTEIDLEAYINISNPGTDIEVLELDYTVFADEFFLGEESKRDLTIPTGNSTIELPFTLDLFELNRTIPEISIQENQTFQDLDEDELEEIPVDEEVELEVETEITVPIEWFNLVTITDYTISMDHAQVVEIPEEYLEED